MKDVENQFRPGRAEQSSIKRTKTESRLIKIVTGKGSRVFTSQEKVLESPWKLCRVYELVFTKFEACFKIVKGRIV